MKIKAAIKTLVSLRDMEIFRSLRETGPRRVSELSGQFWQGRSEVAHAGQKRIKKLMDGGYLERGNPRLVFLTEKAKELLRGFETAGSTLEEESGIRTDFANGKDF